ncbi:DUF1365 domain-containing protein [Caulobacter sp. KR2-114]|uniref:DUF1365 domain-containing protein n=1 Tax=Caulobacter sp. KR2-114 TaxID=3400912 RepID=UPI003C088427
MSGPAPSALYAGEVTHLRLAPRRHRLRYRLFQLLIDLDEGPQLGGRLALFGWNRPAALSVWERDHGDGRPTGLKAYVETLLAEAGIALGPGGRIAMLAMPRMLGHVFNPISIFFCRRADGTVAAMLYEVNNTFGQRHSYLIPVSADAATPADLDLRQSCAKALHVSPFMPMEMRYAFRIAQRDGRLSTAIQGRDALGQPLIVAVFRGDRRPLTDRMLARALLAWPLMTLGVVAAIHWEALKLWLKGVRLLPEPPAPSTAVSVADHPLPGRP